MPVDLEQFRKDREFCDLSKTEYGITNDIKPGTMGYAYCEGWVAIEKLPDNDWTRKHGTVGKWNLAIGNEETTSDNLENLEERLFEFAEAEGYTDYDPDRRFMR